MCFVCFVCGKNVFFVKNQYCIKAGSVSQNMKKNIFLEMHICGMGSVCEEKYDDSAWHM